MAVATALSADIAPKEKTNNRKGLEPIWLKSFLSIPA